MSSTPTTSRPAVATAATVTYPVEAGGQAIHLSGIEWSFSADLDAPVELTVEVDGTTTWAEFITVSGPGQFQFEDAMDVTPATTSTVITLPSGGAAVTGTLNVRRKS